MLKIRKVADNSYRVTAAPPHVEAAWSSDRALSGEEPIQELLARGCHQQDVGDALYEEDAAWLEKLK